MPDRRQIDGLAIGLETAVSNRNFAGTLVGTCLAILTFLLIFLYGRASSGEIDTTLFQATLLVIVIAIFSFAFSGNYYYDLTVSLATSNPKAKSELERADACLILGLLLLALEPALIMFTLRLTIVGLIALGLWLAYVCFVLLEAKRRRYVTFRTKSNPPR